MNEQELKQEEQRRNPRWRNVLLGIGFMVFGLMMAGRMATASHHHAHHAQAHATAGETAAAQAQSGADEAQTETRSHRCGNRSSRADYQESYDERRGASLFTPFRVMSKLAGIGLIAGGLALMWRRRDPNYAYSHDSVQDRMAQEFDDESGKPKAE